MRVALCNKRSPRAERDSLEHRYTDFVYTMTGQLPMPISSRRYNLRKLLANALNSFLIQRANISALENIGFPTMQSEVDRHIFAKNECELWWVL